MKYAGIREEELKNRVAYDFFDRFDTTEIIDNIDFAVKHKQVSCDVHFSNEYLLWAEAKQGSRDICASFVQLILTVGQSGTVGHRLPPAFLGAFDAEKIAFIPYIDIADVFTINDFNWKVTPSNHEAKEFRLLYDRVKTIIDERMYLYEYEKEEAGLLHFIRNNLPGGEVSGKVQITKNNFIHIYLRWLEEVKPHINFNWEGGKKAGVLDCDFYQADLFVDDKNTDIIEDDTPVIDKLSVIFREGKYWIVTEVWGNNAEMAFGFRKGGKERYAAFWKKYKRPPPEEYWRYIVDRRDLLVPQDIRERKGSFFTPRIWVEKSQEYLAKTFGEDWQEEYYVWDCCAGTGNLLEGLTNKYNIWASTLDKADVDVMHDRIENGATLLHAHVFQFDFLNDSFDKLPEGLQKIINDERLRKRLIIYINPPYAEASKMRTLQTGNEGSKGVEQTGVNRKYAHLLGQGNAELFAQFFTRIYCELQGVILAEFSTLKILQGQHFVDFRKFFLAKLKKMFVCPAATFDNVKGSFPIGFLIWDTNKQEVFKSIKADVYDKDGNRAGIKKFYALTDNQYINDWIKPFRAKKFDQTVIGKFPFKGNDFQNQNLIAIVNPETAYNVEAGQFLINPANLIVAAVYFAVRKVIPASWLNDRDQFLFPNRKWEKDIEFQNNCLVYTLFHTNISSKQGVNHWIPFREEEVNPRTRYESHVMISFLSGKVVKNAYTGLFEQLEHKRQSKFGWEEGKPREFSAEATAVFDAGRELWRYYHQQQDANADASLYDIREYFQGRDAKGKMNNKSANETYNELIGHLRMALKVLAGKIDPKVYEYGFLKD
jgi:hypothetical protein